MNTWQNIINNLKTWKNTDGLKSEVVCFFYGVHLQ